MAVNHLLLAFFVVVAVAFLSICSAEYTPEENYPSYEEGYSLKRYTPQGDYNNPSYYKEGHSLERDTPQEDHPSYEEGHSLERYTPQGDYNNPSYYKEGHSLERNTPQEDHPTYKEGHSLERDVPQEDDKCAKIKIQGMIYCKDNGKLSPMQGATARVTCMVKDTKNGYETTPLSVETPLTDKKGYFLINMANYVTPRYSISNCRVFLDEAASEYCYVPTNTNNGVTGAHLHKSKSRHLNSDDSTLYSVGPFAFKTPSY